jgi:hypothetical protein
MADSRPRLVPIESVALIPRCAECEAHWLPADQERWSAYLTDDEPAEIVFYCPLCAEREFGEE